MFLTEKIQNIYISILNRLYSCYAVRMDKKAKEAYMLCIFMALAASFLLIFSNRMSALASFTLTLRNIFTGVMLLLVSLFSMEGSLRPVGWRWSIMLPYYLGAMGLVITGTIHPIGDGYFSFGVMMLLVYPCLYIVWNNRGDYEALFDIIAKANEIVGVAAFVLCMISRPAEVFQLISWGVGVHGGYANSNLFSMSGMCLACAAIYMIYRESADAKKRGIHFACLLIGAFIVIIGQSRASFAIIVASTIVSLWYYRKNNSVSSGIMTKKTALIIALASVAFVTALILVISANSEGGIVSKFSSDGKTLDGYMSGRITLWSSYASHLNLLGNDFDATDWMALTGGLGHAHNNFLEFGYRCGVPVALTFLLLDLFSGIRALTYLFSRKYSRDCYLFTIIFMGMYALESMVDIATIPMERQAPFFFYIIICVFLDAEQEGTSRDGRA